MPQILYKFVATILLTRHPRLPNLSYVEDKSSRRIQNLPSSVPDYSCPDVPRLLSILRMSNFDFECCPQRYGPVFVNITPEESLDTRGAVFDRIVAASEPISNTLDSHDISRTHMDQHNKTLAKYSGAHWLPTLTTSLPLLTPYAKPSSTGSARTSSWLSLQKRILALPKNKHSPTSPLCSALSKMKRPESDLRPRLR